MVDGAPERALTRDRWIIGGGIVVIVALAWAELWREQAIMAAMPGMDTPDMPEMNMGPPAPATYLLSAFLMWFVMMAAMMLPSAAPMILLYGRVARSARAQGASIAPTALFASVYLAVWAGFSVVAALAQWALVRAGAVSELTLAFGDKRIAGALLIAAGLYQITPLKRLCLRYCRSPFEFLMRLWRPGLAGAARLGFVHGLYCLGCCAALMALLFVFGVMNLAWVAALAVFVLAEKALPFGERVSFGAGIVAIIAGLAFVLS
jgi:predicted metal-binding membrane protein